MARVTVEDCKKVISDHFELVVLASRRGRDIGAGSPILVERSNDKNAVIALREIAARKLNIDLLREKLLEDFRKIQHVEENLSDSKKENYIESDEFEENNFEHNFESELAQGMSGIEITSGFDDDVSFEDEEKDLEN